jgi:F0F1-type ATP synthase delta subunit
MVPEISKADSQRQLQLPTLIASSEDLGRLIHELALINEALLQLSLRAGGTTVKMPKTSRLMDHLVQLNGLNLLQPADRESLMQYFVALRTTAPILHISFSADPSPAFIEKLIVWLRREIHPEVFLTVGLQPSIGAGCILRTTNRYFDPSLRQDFANKRALLLNALVATETPA